MTSGTRFCRNCGFDVETGTKMEGLPGHGRRGLSGLALAGGIAVGTICGIPAFVLIGAISASMHGKAGWAAVFGIEAVVSAACLILLLGTRAGRSLPPFLFSAAVAFIAILNGLLAMCFGLGSPRQ